MFESLRVRHFQIHSDFLLELDSSVTVLTGRTDIGKSSLLRALRWLCLNEPDGESFIPTGEDSCSVTLKVDGHKISRIRGSGKNLYRLDSQVYKAFGRAGVPEDIAQLLNVGPANFSQQLDAPLWFTLPASQVSRELNAVVDLGAIDDCLARVASETRRVKVTVEVSRQRLREARQERDSLVWVPSAFNEFTGITSLRERIDTETSAIAQAGRTISDAAGLRSRLDQVALGLREALKQVRELDSIRVRLREVQAEVKSLEKFTSLLKMGKEKQCLLTAQIANLEQELGELVKDGCPLCGAPMPP